MISFAIFFFTGVAQGAARGLKHLRPIIEQRLRNANEYGNKEVENPVCSCITSRVNFIHWFG